MAAAVCARAMILPPPRLPRAADTPVARVSDSAWATLRVMLVERYEELANALSRHVGSKDAAEEALQETFVRLSRDGEESVVRNPRSYLFRMALNAAASQKRSERRRLSPIDADAVLDALADDRPDAEQVAADRSTLLLVRKLVAQMPDRRQRIVRAAWFDDLPYQEIADRHGLSLRMIQIELKHAIAHVTEGLAKAGVHDFAKVTRGTSIS